MFTAFLREHPMKEMILKQDLRLYPTAEDRKAWEDIPAAYREEIRRLAAEYGRIPYPARTASGFLAFVRNGDRQADEQPYFTRRRKLCAAALDACAFPDNANMDEIVDGIWLVCEETSWVISAHNVNPIPGAPPAAEYPLPDLRKPYIDLFSAQTGMILSLTAALLGKRLDAVSPMIRERIREEIRRRILRPFMATDDFWWMGFRRKDLNNWTPWILSNILICAVTDPTGSGEPASLLIRACEMLDRWLETVPEDGGCDEGAGYWNMAGGALLDCLEILEKATDGRMRFWENEKIRSILAYPAKVEMGNGWFANFADCDARPFISGERMETAGEMIGDPALTALGTRMRGTIADQLNDVPHLTRALDLIFHPAAEKKERPEIRQRDEWLPELQVRLIEKGKWMLACKGGHNGENHNHNDVGSFILMKDGEPVIVDAGNMTYTAKTFSGERYTLWNVRAGFHNLPMIGSCEQREGAEHAARDVHWEPDGLELELSGTYDEAVGVRQLKRCFALSEEGLRLTDEIALETAQPVTWVFMLRNRPVWKDGEIMTGEIAIQCPEGLTFTAEEIPITDARMKRSWPGSLWRVLLRSEPRKTFQAEFILAGS